MIERSRIVVLQDDRADPLECLATGAMLGVFAQFVGQMGQLWQGCLLEPVSSDHVVSGQVEAAVEIVMVTAIGTRAGTVDERHIAVEETDIHLCRCLWIEERQRQAVAIVLGQDIGLGDGDATEAIVCRGRAWRGIELPL